MDFLGGKVRVVVDDDNGVDLFDECHEDNNTIELDQASCLGQASDLPCMNVWPGDSGG